MKTSVAILAYALSGVRAHYFFEKTVRNGVEDGAFQYVRPFTRATSFNPIKFSSNPPEDIRDGSTVDGPDIVCNQGGQTTGGQTEILTVNAGDSFDLKLGVGARMEHPGPILAYMSKATGDLQAYTGDGDWFKIMEEGVCFPDRDFTSDAWCKWGKDRQTVTIPADIPDGFWMLRIESIGVHRSHVNQPEHYVSCVQLEVVNGGSGNPTDVVKFPGAYKDTDEYANFSIYGGLKDFPMPGPSVYVAGSSGGSPPVDNTPVEETPVEETPVEQPPVEQPSNGGNPPKCGGSRSSKTKASADSPPSAACAGIYQQCGGRAFSGPSCCSAGSCQVLNPYYAQCL